jgi:mRNA-degrading endonuclease toxin of MazEF toxin-antitoxin module
MNGSGPKFGWLYWCEHLYTDATGSKKRPCVVVSSKRALEERPGEVVLFPLTSKLRHADSPGTVTVVDHESAGLDRPSAIKPMPFTVARGKLGECIGELDERTRKALDKVARQILGAG